METLVFFLVIGALQLLASYIKQKKEKEAARKAPPPSPSRPVASPERRSPPPQAAPLPDPLKEVLRHLGVPEVPPAPPAVEKRSKAPVEQNRTDQVEERSARSFEETHKPVQAKMPYTSDPAKGLPASPAAFLGDLGASIEDTAKAADAAARSSLQEYSRPEELRKGVIWTTILQEPRFRRPWRTAQP